MDVNLRDSPETQSTPLHWAASYGNKDIVQCLCCEFRGMGNWEGGGGCMCGCEPLCCYRYHTS